jgi:hypothetical protein
LPDRESSRSAALVLCRQKGRLTRLARQYCTHAAIRPHDRPRAYLRPRSPHGAGWSSLVARRAYNPKVANSHPTPGRDHVRSPYENSRLRRTKACKRLCYPVLAELSECNPERAHWVSTVSVLLSFPFHQPKGTGFSISGRARRPGPNDRDPL